METHTFLPRGAKMRSDGSIMTNEVRFNPLFPFDRPDLPNRVLVGGTACDQCRKTLQESGLDKLDFCSRCKMMYYCSKNCQKTAWKAGHDQACRKKKEIKVGDDMQLFCLKSKPELNGKLVEIIGPDPKAEGRWVTRLLVNPDPSKANGTISVATENLKHIRPAK